MFGASSAWTHDQVGFVAGVWGWFGDEAEAAWDWYSDLGKMKAADIDKVMTPAYTREYESLMGTAKAGGYDLSKSQDLKRFVNKKGLSPEGAKLLEVRHMLNDELGANEMFLGNGLTLDSSAATVRMPLYGVVETFTYDKAPMSLLKLENSGVLKRVPLTSVK